MTDGILDITVLILVLGIVLGACFGFVIPIIDNTQMGFDESLDDKSATFMVEDKNSASYTGDMNIVECMLTLCVQDSKVPAPKVLDVVKVEDMVELSSYTSLDGLVTPEVPKYKTMASVTFDGLFRNNIQLYCISVDKALKDVYGADYNKMDTLYNIEYMYNVAATNDFTAISYDDKFKPHDCELDDVTVYTPTGSKVENQSCIGAGGKQYNHEYFDRYILKKVG